MAVSPAGGSTTPIRQFIERNGPASNERLVRAREQFLQAQRSASPPEAQGFPSPSTSPSEGPGSNIDITA